MVARWQATVDVHNRPKTRANNAQMARDHVNPTIGAIRVTQLEHDDIQRLVNRMASSGLSRGTIQNAVGLVRTVLRHGIVEGTVVRDVTLGVRYPEASGERLPSLTTAQLRRFLEGTKGEPLWPVWALLGTTAIRIGELLGLRWKDIGTEAPPAIAEGADSAIAIHSAAGVQSVRAITARSRDSAAPRSSYNPVTIAIAGQYRTVVVKDAEGKRIGLAFPRVEPKTPGSRRELHLPALAREAIRVQRAQATSAVVVFARHSGEGPMERAWLNRQFHKALTAHRLPSVRLHSLRHSALVAILDGTAGDLRAAQSVARHRNIQTTVSVYGRDADEARKRGAAAMDKVMEEMG